MFQKTLGEVAMHAHQTRSSDDVLAWQAVADAVVAAHEARRWKAWLRGAVESHINTCNLITSITSATKSHPARQGLMAAGNELHNQLDRYRALLASAEHRDYNLSAMEQMEKFTQAAKRLREGGE